MYSFMCGEYSKKTRFLGYYFAYAKLVLVKWEDGAKIIRCSSHNAVFYFVL